MTATLFDFNGVLVDDEAVHLEAFREALRPLGLGVDTAAYEERYIGYDDAGAFRAIAVDAGRELSPSEIAQLIEVKKPIYMEKIAGALVVYDGAAEILRRRAARGIVGIVSGALRPEIEHALDVLGASDVVSFIVAAEDTQRCKPDPEGYLLALEALSARGHTGPAVVIEDSLAGVRAAKSAGLRCAAVAHSYAAARLRDAGADVVTARLADLTDAMLDGRDPAAR